MTRLMTALLNGDNLFAATTFNKGKSAPPPPPNIAPKPPVEEASVDMEGDKKNRLNTGKATLKMPLATAKTTGLKM